MDSREKTEQCLSLSAFCYGWALNTMYMSSEPMYFFALAASTLALYMLSESFITLMRYDSGLPINATKESSN